MQCRLDATRIAALPGGLCLSGWFVSCESCVFVWLAVPSEQWSTIFGALPDTLVASAASSRMRRPVASSAPSAHLSTRAYEYLAHHRFSSMSCLFSSEVILEMLRPSSLTGDVSLRDCKTCQLGSAGLSNCGMVPCVPKVKPINR